MTLDTIPSGRKACRLAVTALWALGLAALPVRAPLTWGCPLPDSPGNGRFLRQPAKAGSSGSSAPRGVGQPGAPLQQATPSATVTALGTNESPTAAAPASATPTVVPATIAPTNAVASPTAMLSPTSLASATPAGRSGESSELASTPPVPREERPIIVVRDFRAEPDRPAAGTVFSLVLVLQNVGERFAENVRLSLESTVFLPASSGAMPFVNKLSAGEAVELPIPLRVAAGTAEGPQALTIALGWDDSYGGTYGDKTTIGIDVSGSANRPLLVISAVRVPARVSPGIPFDLHLDLVNTGGREARNVTLVLSGPPLAVMAGGAGVPMSLASGGKGHLALRVVAAAPSQPGATAQAVELRYDGPDGQRYTETQSVGLVVTGSAVAAPLPVVSGYQVVPEELHPGEVFRLALAIANLGAADAEQLRVVIGGDGVTTSGAGGASGGATTAGSAFSPLGAGNVRFLGRLAADQERRIEQSMVVASSAKPGVQTLSVGLVYLDALGQLIQDSQVITLLVSRRVRLQINPVDVVTSTVVGEMLPITFEVINVGTEEVTVTTAEVEPGRYMRREGGVEYLGGLTTGAPYPVSATLWPQAPTRDAVVRLVVHYLDDFGREQSVAKEVHIEVRERPAVEAGEAVNARPPRSLVMRVILGLLGLGASSTQPPTSEKPTAPGAPGKQTMPSPAGAAEPAAQSGEVVPVPTPAAARKTEP